MSEFKVGDRVRLVWSDALEYPPVGTEGTVAKVGLGVLYPIDVQFDGYPHRHGYPVRLDEIERVDVVSEDAVWTVKWRDGYVESSQRFVGTVDGRIGVGYLVAEILAGGRAAAGIDPIEIRITKEKR